MTTLTWLITIALLALSPQFRFTYDRMNYDGERFVSLCGGLYQMADTWTCLEIP